MPKPTPLVEIWCDGACSPNPGRGAWAAVLRCRGTGKVVTGTAPETTNNRMEVEAIIGGLQALKEPCRVHVYTDSQYAASGAKNAFSGVAYDSNTDLWVRLVQAAAPHHVEAYWVRRSEHPGQREAHRLANDALAPEVG